ncbi:MAG: Ribonuclease J (endonuclease and 5' exonuclease) [uncultured Sphingomonas sp.]|uniref:Ribonuclease J (Endonuclease and 5' exonuclease) n=1 Tax=uncultured Sphingomonas sp. TaxID=158754 RepID=A0A6J4SW67_9SPHN|nr:MAG: Ribonuclease J (endonuclease and 5' exonuclease) [uncultured Sphingomonas sp.]
MTPGNELLFLALGGSGEIGMNVNLYGSQGKWLMVDCGMTFGDNDYPGIDLILPDLEFIEKRRRDLVGLVLTHGHEDHIGAIPYLAADLGVPLYATPFTAGLIAHKLEEEGLTGQVKVKLIQPGDVLELGPFTVTPVPLAHSIPEANALVIETRFGRIFHTGDWKLDRTPVLGNPTSPEALTAIGDKGVLAMICDSTNAFTEQESGSEAEVYPGLLKVVTEAPGRVLVTTFASNAARLHTIGKVAEESGRRIAVAGRSIERYIKVAKATGYLRDFPETVRYDEAMRMPRRELLILATGGQGEPRAALGRIASGQHELKLGEGDTVVFSSRQIPGNEVAVGRVMNELAVLGVRTVTERQAHVHVSGHPGRPELVQMYHWIRPELLIPVHGERRHMLEQARLGLDNGVPAALVQENGDLIRLAPGAPKKLGEERVGRLVLDGDVILTADGSTMNERRKLAYQGMIAVSLAVDGRGKLLGKPVVRPVGVPVEADREDFIRDAVDLAARAVQPGLSADKLHETIRLAVRRCATLWTGKKPIVEVLVVRP